MGSKSVKATVASIRALTPRAEKFEVSIAGYPGLIVRVQPSGSHTFVYRHRQDGQLRRIALKATSLGAAIAEWAAERQDAKQGVDVAARKTQEKAAKKLKRVTDRRDPTIAELVERYIVEYAQRRKRSWKADASLLARFATPLWGQLKANTIRRADVHSLVHSVARDTPIQANRLLAVVRKVFSYALDAGIIDTHPCLRMKAPSQEHARDRVLTNDELKALWNADNLNSTFSNALRLQLLSGCRIGEVIGASAADFDVNANTWTIPASRAKNKMEHVVPLSPTAQLIVQSIKPAKGFLFPWPTAQGCMAPDTVAHLLIDAIGQLGLDPFTTHDLRRTVSTRLGELGFSQETRQRVLGHKNRSVLAIHYDKYDGMREKREALDTWARQLEEIVSGPRPRTIVELRRTKR